MSEQIGTSTVTPPPALPPGPSVETKPEGGANIKKIVIIAAGGLIAVMVLLFVIALILALTTDVASTGPIIRLIRDLVIIILALEGILIVLGLAVLILQVARLINLIQTEVKPILESTQDTVKTAQNTVTFVSANVSEPIIRAGSFLAGAGAVTKEAFGLFRALRLSKKED
jgi:hypothetical protein